MLNVSGGINFDNGSKSRELPVQNFASPEFVFFDLKSDHELFVSENDIVQKGQLIASQSNSHCPIYSSISGKVCSIENNIITIQNDLLDTHIQVFPPFDAPLTDLQTKDIENAVRILGIYDRQIPLFQKINLSHDKIENIIVNCTCSEPPSGISYRILSDKFKELIGGLKILIHATKARRGIITIDDKSNKIYNVINKQISDTDLITIRVVENKYPIENDKYLIFSLTRKEYQDKGLIENSKCLVLKPESIINLFSSLTTGMPVTDKLVTVYGGVKESKNLLVPLGTKISQVIDFCGGTTRESPKIIVNGIMSGFVADENQTITQNINSITIIENQEYTSVECIRCGKCIRICPMLLKPLYLYSNILRGAALKNKKLGIEHCINCGCCSYVCPSKIPLSQIIGESLTMKKE